MCLSFGLFLAGALAIAKPAEAAVGVAPTSLSFGSVTVNTKSAAMTVALTNNSRRSASVTGVSSSLAQFLVTSPALPIRLAAHSTTSFQVMFQPNAAQNFNGTIVVTYTRQDGETSTDSIAISGTGKAAAPSQTYLLSASTSSLTFGNALVGSTASQTMTLTNSGTGSVTISQAAITGAGFSFSGCSGTVTLTAGQTLILTVRFAPPSVGAVTGSINIVSSATNSPTSILLTGTGIQPQISIIPASISFSSVTVNTTNTQSLTIRNAGTANLTVIQATLAGSGFTLSGLTLPLSVAPGASSVFNIGFTPASASTFSGSLTLVNNSPNSPLVVAMVGTGISPVLQITPTPSSLSFGNITTGTSTMQSVTLANTGNASVTLSQIAESGTGFAVSGCTLPLTVAAGQSTSFNVTFDPATTGNLSGSVTVTSNATNSPQIISLSGTGTAVTTYSVSLSWSPSSSSYSGFNVYRSTQSGGPYAKVNSTLIPNSPYSDPNVVAGDTYYYVATEVNTLGVESAYSTPVTASIP